MQSLLMTVSIYTHPTKVSNCRFEAMSGKCDGQFLLNCYIEENKKVKFQFRWIIGKFWHFCCVLPKGTRRSSEKRDHPFDKSQGLTCHYFPFESFTIDDNENDNFFFISFVKSYKIRRFLITMELLPFAGAFAYLKRERCLFT